MAHPKQHLSMPSWLRLKNETPGVQAALLAAPLLAGAAAIGLFLLSRRGRESGGSIPGGWLARILAGSEVDVEGRDTLAYIQKTVRGLDKSSVRRLLGEPSAAGEGGLIVSRPTSVRQRGAASWYYRLDRLRAPLSGRTTGAALVVEFDGRDRVADARFLLPPR